MTFGSCFGSYFQRILASLLRSSAKTGFGNGPCTYMTLPITSGPPSWPRRTPVENVHATCSLPTFWAVICLSWEERGTEPLRLDQLGQFLARIEHARFDRGLGDADDIGNLSDRFAVVVDEV